MEMEADVSTRNGDGDGEIDLDWGLGYEDTWDFDSNDLDCNEELSTVFDNTVSLIVLLQSKGKLFIYGNSRHRL